MRSWTSPVQCSDQTSAELYTLPINIHPHNPPRNLFDFTSLSSSANYLKRNKLILSLFIVVLHVYLPLALLIQRPVKWKLIKCTITLHGLWTRNQRRQRRSPYTCKCVNTCMSMKSRCVFARTEVRLFILLSSVNPGGNSTRRRSVTSNLSSLRRKASGLGSLRLELCVQLHVEQESRYWAAVSHPSPPGGKSGVEKAI